MSEKMALNVDLRDAQEKVEDSMKNAQDLSRKMFLATVGMYGLAYDKGMDVWKAGMDLVDKAEKRGEEIEQVWMKQFNKLQEQAEVKKVVDYVEDQVDSVSKNAKSVVAEVEKILAQFQPKLEEAAKEVAIKVESAIENVFPGYDEMPAKDIVVKLPELHKDVLVVVREYEVQNKNRVTVLREIDALLEAPEPEVVVAA